MLGYLDPGPSQAAGPSGSEALLLLVVIGTTIWAFFDAPARGLSR
jgi:hypothetical protein